MKTKAKTTTAMSLYFAAMLPYWYWASEYAQSIVEICIIMLAMAMALGSASLFSSVNKH